MIAACSEAGATLAVHFHNRWDPLFVRVRDLIADGAIGSLISASGSMGPELVHEAGHMFDLFRFMVGGEVAWVVGQLDDEPAAHLDPGGSGYLMFRNGVHAFLNATKGCPVGFEFDFVGTKGRIRIGYFVDELWTVEEGLHEGRALVGRKIPQHVEARSGTVKAIEELAACVAGEKEISCTGEDGRAALEVALAIHRSHREGGARIDLPLVDETTVVGNPKYGGS
jgi:predicted dehydrogenase